MGRWRWRWRRTMKRRRRRRRESVVVAGDVGRAGDGGEEATGQNTPLKAR